MNERERVIRTVEENENDNNFSRDAQLQCIREMAGGRRERSTGGTRMQSKFVTVVTEEQVELKKQSADSDSDQPEIFYAFGYKFYYWPKYKNNEDIDEHHNGGEDAFGLACGTSKRNMRR